MPDTGRMYSCARCRAQVVVCRRCDRGQIYCFAGCAAQARDERQREAARRYQASRRGRLAHAERSRRYRLRRHRPQNVTHQGSVALRADDLLRLEVTMRLPDPVEPIALREPAGTKADIVTDEAVPPATSGSSCCQRCGAHCAAGLRFGFLRHHRRPSTPAWLIPAIDRALHRAFDDHRP